MPSRAPALPVAPEDEPEPFSAVLRRMAAADGDTLTLDEVASTFAGRGFGPVMLVFALINLLPWPPGGTSLVGLPLLVISAELAAGQREVWLPRWLEKASVSRRTFAGLLRRFDRPIDWVERVSRPRLAPLSSPLGARLAGLASLILSIILVLPIWGGNFAPAAAMAFFALGLVQRDGLAMLAGWAVTAATAVILILAWRLIVAHVDEAWAWVAGLF